MIFLLAPDSFKESLTAEQACAAMAAGIQKVIPTAIIEQVPLADGGEGTLRALVTATGGKIFTQEVTGPLGNRVTGEYGILGDKQTGVVEIASASGLHLVPLNERNPGKTTTLGTGQLIRQVLMLGVKKLIICLGGSATNDGGAGIAQALGVRFFNQAGEVLYPVGDNLHQIARIDVSGMISLPPDLTVEVACDVTNPLTGKLGATHIYGPQKGATPEQLNFLDNNLNHYGDKIKEYLGIDIKDTPGAGAAGGAGGGMLAFLPAKLVSGIDLVLKHTALEEKIKRADYIFTGEGSIDHQTIYGKTISGVIALARKHHKPVIAFAGKVAATDELYAQGLTAVFGITPGVVPLQEALENGNINLQNTTTAVVRLLQEAKGLARASG